MDDNHCLLDKTNVQSPIESFTFERVSFQVIQQKVTQWWDKLGQEKRNNELFQSWKQKLSDEAFIESIMNWFETSSRSHVLSEKMQKVCRSFIPKEQMNYIDYFMTLACDKEQPYDAVTGVHRMNVSGYGHLCFPVVFDFYEYIHVNCVRPEDINSVTLSIAIRIDNNVFYLPLWETSGTVQKSHIFPLRNHQGPLMLPRSHQFSVTIEYDDDALLQPPIIYSNNQAQVCCGIVSNEISNVLKTCVIPFPE